MTIQTMLCALILLPFVAAFLIAIAGNKMRTLHSGIAAAASGIGLLLLLTLAGQILGGEAAMLTAPWVPAIGLEFTLLLDPLGLMFASLILGIGLLVIIYAHFYLAEEKATGRFFASLMLFQGAMLGIVVAGNLLLMLIFWELTSLSSFLLIGFWRHNAEARQGARIALYVTAGGGLLLIAGMLLLGIAAGSFDLMMVLGQKEAIQTSPLYPAILILVLGGCFTKSAQFPFHFWLPHAMAAPTPVSAYLHSATMVKAGVFLLARLWPILSGTELFTVIVTSTGSLTMLLGAWVALFRHDLKAILAYSTIGQLGLLVMLLGLSLKLAAIAAVFHILNHAVFKAALFMTTGIINHETGERDIRRLGGLAKMMPITAAIGTIAAAAMAGVPPLGGFVSKEMMLSVTLDGQLFALPWIVPVVATSAALLSAAYSFRFAAHAFYGSRRIDEGRIDETGAPQPHDPGAGMWIPAAALAILAILFGIVPMSIAAPLVAAAAGAVIGAQPPAVELALWHGANLPLGMSLLALAGGALLLLWHRPIQARYDMLRHIDAKALFMAAIGAADTAVRKVMVAAHVPSLQRMLFTLFAVVVFAVVEGAIIGGGRFTGTREGTAASLPAITAWGLLIAAAVAVVSAGTQRFRALIYLSVIGLVVSLSFVHLSAPDLALTQISVEVVTVLLLLLALNLLPKNPPQLSSIPHRLRDGVLAILGGLGVGAAAWAMLTRPSNDPISHYHVANSYAEGGGTNIVNVTLVDFRAFDTLGEITVLGIAGLAIYALLDSALRGIAGARLSNWRADMPYSPERHPVMFVMATRILLPLTLTAGLYIFLRGHNQPGGGFIAGLVIAIAFLLQYLASGFDWTVARRRVGEHALIAFGVLMAVATGLGPLVFGANFLTSTFGYVHLPLVGELELASAMLFDVGVFSVVLGAVMLALAQISRISQYAARSHRLEDRSEKEARP